MLNSLSHSRFIFVGGAPRSGTTLVQNILDSHPVIYGGPEFLHLPDIVGLRNKLRQSIAKEWITEYCSNNDLDRRVSSLIEDFLLPLADKHGCDYLSEKSPHNVLVFKELMKLFPEAYFIQVIRDPRGIIASMLQVGKRGKEKGWKTQDFTMSLVPAIRHVKSCFTAGLEAAALNPNRVLTVVYENLVADPESETKTISNFLRIEWVREMMYPGNLKHPGEKAICNDVWYDEKTYARNPEPKEIDKWQRTLSPMQKIVINSSFRNFEGLDQFGYDFSSESFFSMENIIVLSLLAVRNIKLRIWSGNYFRRARKISNLN